MEKGFVNNCMIPFLLSKSFVLHFWAGEVMGRYSADWSGEGRDDDELFVLGEALSSIPLLALAYHNIDILVFRISLVGVFPLFGAMMSLKRNSLSRLTRAIKCSNPTPSMTFRDDFNFHFPQNPKPQDSRTCRLVSFHQQTHPIIRFYPSGSQSTPLTHTAC